MVVSARTSSLGNYQANACCRTFNVQAFIRRASSMADKPVGRNPRARMAYGDSIAARGRLEAGAASAGADVRRPGRVERRGADGSDGVAQRCARVVGGRRGAQGRTAAASPAPRSAGRRCRGVGDAASGGIPGWQGRGQPFNLAELALLADRQRSMSMPVTRSMRAWADSGGAGVGGGGWARRARHWASLGARWRLASRPKFTGRLPQRL
jgi:hypothetical protein